MVYINNGIAYHMSKYTKKFCVEIGLLYMIWLAQLPDLNPSKTSGTLLKYGLVVVVTKFI